MWRHRPLPSIECVGVRVCNLAVHLSLRGMEEGTNGDDIISPSISWRCFVRWRQGGGEEINAQSSSKRQPHANTTVKAVKCNVRAFPAAAGSIEQHAESWSGLASTLASAADRWSARQSRRLVTLEVGLQNYVRKPLGIIIGDEFPTEKHTAKEKGEKKGELLLCSSMTWLSFICKGKEAMGPHTLCTASTR